MKLNHELRAVLALDDEALVAVEQLTKQRGVRAADRQHAVELLQLLDADGAAELQRPDVVAGHDESVGLEEIVGAALVDRSSRPARRAPSRELRIARAR